MSRFDEGDVVIIHKPIDAWHNSDVYWSDDMDFLDGSLAEVEYYEDECDGYSLAPFGDDYAEKDGYNANDFWMAEEWLELYVEDNEDEIDVSCFESLDINLLR